MALKDSPVEPGLDLDKAVLWQEIDSSRQEAVLLCGERGRVLFCFLLASSARENSTAIVSLKRLADIAHDLGWSPDTVKRYVAVFRAINLVSHYRGKLLLPLGPYHPLTALTILDELVEKRAKQRQLALKVRTRYILRYPTQNHSEKMQLTLQHLKTILDDEHLEPLKRERLQIKIAEVITSLAGIEARYQGDPKAVLGDVPVGASSKKLDGTPEMGDPKASKGALATHLPSSSSLLKMKMGDLKIDQGDPTDVLSLRVEDNTKPQGDLKTNQGDPAALSPLTVASKEEPQGDLKTDQGDRRKHASQPAHPSLDQKGDLDAHQGDLNAGSTSQKGDPDTQSELAKGDSAVQQAHQVQVDALYTYNVSYLINNINKGDNAIRRRSAQFLAKVLEKQEYENGYPTFSKYLKTFKFYTPEVIGRAFLTTMILIHRKGWQVENPGAVFTNQCKVLSGQKPLTDYTLDEVEEWMRSWAGLAYPELIVALAVPAAEQQPAALLNRPQKTLSSNGSQNNSGYGGRVSYGTQRKRTYGMAYTGGPGLVNKSTSINNSGSPVPPSKRS